jgi:DUF1680 family protein
MNALQTHVVDTRRSPYARLQPVPLQAVKLTSSFWAPRMQRNINTAIPHLHDLLEEHGVVDNFRRLYGASQPARRGFLFTDSDLFKWMEAAAYAQVQPQADLHTRLDDAIDAALPAQGADGYLNTWFVDERRAQRWSDLDSAHEMYCAGHLFQAAVADARTRGDLRLLGASTRYADYIDQTFRQAGRPGSCGHPEVEMALVELFRQTGEERYLSLAGHFIDQRGAMRQSGINGHAVRALYYLSGAADVYLETGREDLMKGLLAQYDDLLRHKLYITGGIGGRYTGEAVGKAFELPNERAYTETCAAIAFIFFTWRMLQATGEAVYADMLERAMYNGFLSGVSLAGSEYFYVNPLAYDGLPEEDPWYAWARKGLYTRQPWHECTCCPPNVQRLLATLPAYFYSTSREGVWLHLYGSSSLETQLVNGVTLKLEQTSNYPWEGKVEITLQPSVPAEFSLFLRIPSWTTRASVLVDGQSVSAQPGSYLELKRTWQPGSRITLDLDMPVTLVGADPRLADVTGRAAVMRGPLVYCLEGIDHDLQDVRHFRLPAGAAFDIRHQPDLLDGITLLETDGLAPTNLETGSLYTPLPLSPVSANPQRLRFIPYYAWNNRGPSAMNVWVNKDRSLP